MNTTPNAFFAYPFSAPTLKEPIREAVKRINKTQNVFVKIWEDCSISGKIIINKICEEINNSDLFCADLTGINANVMFELGYAISKNKRIWLLLDETYEDQKRQFDQLKILTTIGHAACCNSHEIIEFFFRDAPYNDLEDTIYNNVLAPYILPSNKNNILYLKSLHDNETSIKITKHLDNCGIAITCDDPRESTLQSLSWYVNQLSKSIGVLCHLTNPSRKGARLQTARYALVAGMSHGLEVPLLMISEGNFLSPIDYRDLLKSYTNYQESIDYLVHWITPLKSSFSAIQSRQKKTLTNIQFATELKNLIFGEYIAELESNDLEDYFVETAEYNEALNGSISIFVGRKGSGKSANLIQLNKTLSKDKRNLVCVIKPVSYEMHSIVKLFNIYKGKDTKGYAIESLWKFLLLSEMAKVEKEILDEIPDQAYDLTQNRFYKFVNNNKYILLEDFSVRLDNCVQSLLISQDTDESNIDKIRKGISECLHSSILKELRIELGEILNKYKRITILIDNLDKAWEKTADYEVLSEFLLGLLSTVRNLPYELGKKDSRKKGINISLAVFIRSDIFYRVKQVAREPDKIMYSQLKWNNFELLFRVIEERFSYYVNGFSPSELWERYFCDIVNNKPIKYYIFESILLRPRDLIYLIKQAASYAINRKHPIINEEDIIEAEKQYSLYALESIIVENPFPKLPLEDLLFEFAGSNSIVSESEIKKKLKSLSLLDDFDFEQIIDLLSSLTFIGLEVGNLKFEFSDDFQELKRTKVIAKSFSKQAKRERRFNIHKAFRSFLEIK